MLNILKWDKRQADIAEINAICEKNHVPAMINGGGDFAGKMEKYLKDSGCRAELRFVIDDRYMSEQQKANGMIPFSEYLDRYAAVSPLICGFYDYEQWMKKIERYGPEIHHCYFFAATVVNGSWVDWNLEFVRENMDRFNETYDMLCDEESKGTMEAYLNAAGPGEFDTLFRQHRNVVPYFNRSMGDFAVDRLFDCGAFDGDSAHDFAAAFPSYDHIFEFEPDEANAEKIDERITRENIRDITVIRKGVWSETTVLRFQSEGKSSSSVSADGDNSIEVIKLDDMFDEFTPHSLIKMDIEGSEMKALNGARRVIGEVSPALAICVYHKRDDLISIPRFIDSLVKPGTYEYRLGFQGLQLAELVFYALPKRT